jgi:pimeloyl-ACP methyl ester carboxylesterase
MGEKSVVTETAAGPEVTESQIVVGDTEVTISAAGEGPPLLVLHDELGFSGWLRWTRELADSRRLLVPTQPGFAGTPRVPWVRDYRDLASFYLRMVRQLGLQPVDILGLSAGGYIAAEMTAASPSEVGRLALVAPLGMRPTEGEIFDFLAVTARSHLAATMSAQNVPEIGLMYGGEMTPEQFESFEAARAETSRLGWEPFMHSPSLGDRLRGVDGIEALIVWGESDRIVPLTAMHSYEEAFDRAQLATVPGCGHRPEVETTDRFVELINMFLQTIAVVE